MVTRVAVRSHRRLGRRTTVHVVDWQNVHGLTPSGAGDARPGCRPAAASSSRASAPSRSPTPSASCRAKRRYEVVNALDDERLADVLQELPEDEQADLLRQLDTERAADVLEAMDPDDAADLLGAMTPADAEQLLRRMDPEDSEPVRRLLKHSPDTAGGLMTSEPVVLGPGHHGRRGAGPGARSRPDARAGVAGLRRAPADGHPDRPLPGLRAPAAAAARTAGRAGQRHHRHRPAEPDARRRRWPR